ncbi:CHASE2 domain-containing protein [Leptothoe kymatousa]|uniref:CHASE2 domain-containing protein n=1 Tax=Leptothoe kymatousa TAU-MAC 1615 TaxID=2364775 RepID=A0ABS5Y2B4_9CYAN|nr:CHASE2 domain-containing protein [Leptothoe kymatousa]MBT9311974.1 CHASE2 domain-containing protein [Leptothoe kymatousa TAU-MAC 1615]
MAKQFGNSLDNMRELGKLVVLKIGPGNFQQGFSVTLQIGGETQRPTVELVGALPTAPDLPLLYQQWQTAYRQLQVPHRLESEPNMVTNVSWVGDCQEMADALCDLMNHWLTQADFQAIHNKLLEQLSPSDNIRMVVQTEDPLLKRLPWHQWVLLQRYPRLELALSAPVYEQVEAPHTRSKTVRILAILGEATGLDLATDRSLLQNLPGVDLHFLPAPDRAVLNQYLWQPQGWDILFFAGHSNSTGSNGQISLNAQESLTIPELKYALSKAVQRGLAIAIFNSCDGLGLAQDLADLHIPQILVMREPVPDRVAHEFLKGFLESFSRDTSLYLSVREARERLQGLENEFPCATWLPILCQNLAQQPPTWQSLQGQVPSPNLGAPWMAGALATAVTAATLAMRLLGGLQSLELAAYDRFLRWWPLWETPDHRIVVIENTATDLKQQGLDKTSDASITDETLLKLLQKLETFAPRVIGVDIYHAHPIADDLPELKQRLESASNVVSLCKHPSMSAETGGIGPPPNATLPHESLGFSDLLEDRDSRARRILLAMEPLPGSVCTAHKSFAAIVAAQYLAPGALDNSQNPWLEHVFWPEEHEQFQLQQVKVPRLTPSSGGYRLPAEAFGGYQQLLRYRHLPDLEHIAQSYSLGQVLQADFNGQDLRDRIVLIGTTALEFGGGDIEERDFWKTPYTTSERPEDMIPGVFIQAHIISQLVSAVDDDRPFLSTWNDGVEIAWIMLWAFAGAGLAWYLVKNRFWLMFLTLEVSLFLMCWSLLAVPAIWVPYVPAAIVFTGSVVAVSRYRSYQ